MATRRLPPLLRLILHLLLLALFPRQAVFQDAVYLKQKFRQWSENYPGQLASTSAFVHEQTVISTPEIAHSLFMQSVSRLSSDADRKLQRAKPLQETSFSHFQHFSDPENSGQELTPMQKETRLNVGTNQGNFKEPIIQNTISSIRRKMKNRRVKKNRLSHYQRHLRRRRRHSSSSYVKPAQLHLSTDSQTVPRGKRRMKESREERLARLRLIWRRYRSRRKRPSWRRVSQSQSNKSQSTVGSANNTDGPIVPRSNLTAETKLNDVRNKDRHHTNISSRVIKPSPASRQHKGSAGKPIFSDPPVTLMPTKLASEATTRIASEMTSLYPFIETTKAFNYLASFSSQRVPKRWPLKVVHDETVTPSSSQSVTQEKVQDQNMRNAELQSRTIAQGLSTITSPMEVTGNDNLDNSFIKSSETTPKATISTARDLPTSHIDAALMYERLETKTTPTKSPNLNSDSRLPYHVGETKGMDGNNTVSIPRPQTVKNQPVFVNGSGKTKNISAGLDNLLENKTVILRQETKDTTGLLASGEGSGDEESIELVPHGSDSLTITRTSRRQRKQRLRRVYRRKARNRRKGKTRRKRKKSRPRLKDKKSRAARRAERRRRRKLQRLRRKKLTMFKNNRKRQSRQRSRPEKQEMSWHSQLTPVPEIEETPVTLSQAMNHSGGNVSTSHLIKGAVNVSDIYFHQSLQSRANVTQSSVDMKDISVNMTNSPLIMTEPSVNTTEPFVTMTESSINITKTFVDMTKSSVNMSTPSLIMPETSESGGPLVNLAEPSTRTTESSMNITGSLSSLNTKSSSLTPEKPIQNIPVNDSRNFQTLSLSPSTTVSHFMKNSDLVEGSFQGQGNSTSLVQTFYTNPVDASTIFTGVVTTTSVSPRQGVSSPNSAMPCSSPSPTTSLQSVDTTRPSELPTTNVSIDNLHIASQNFTVNYTSTLELDIDQQTLPDRSNFSSVPTDESDDKVQEQQTERSKSSSTQQPIKEPSASMPSRQNIENRPKHDRNFGGYKTAYDFLSNQNVVRVPQQSEKHRERLEYHRAISERLCKVFKKRFVATGIGGRCV